MLLGSDESVSNSEEKGKILSKNLSRHEILGQFEKLRQQQRQMYAELADQELELQEHRDVIKALKEVNPSQKCFYLMSDALFGKTVEEVFSSVLLAKEKIEYRIEKLNSEVQEMARKVNDFQRIFHIRVKTD